MNKDKLALRRIPVDLPSEIHRKLRVRGAREDVSMQAFVGRVLARAVNDVRLLEADHHRSRKRARMVLIEPKLTRAQAIS